MRKKRFGPYLDMIEITLVIIVSISIIQPFLYFLMKRYSFSAMLSDMVGIILIFSVITLSITTILFLADKLSAFLHYPWLKLIAEISAVSLISYYLLKHIYYYLESSPSPASFKIFVGINLLGCAFVYIFQKGLFMKNKAAEKIHEAELLEKNYAQYRLQALKNQVNPHFLFNSLSVLSSLVHKNAALAEKFVLRLSDAYTYILNQKETDLVTLEEELRFLQSYFFLLQIRFESKISLDIRVADTGYFIPPLILQLLLENAVKHNKMSASQPLCIAVIQNEDCLLVENNINPREKEEESTGLGLENIRKRYLMVDRSDIEIASCEHIYSVKIPLIKK